MRHRAEFDAARGNHLFNPRTREGCDQGFGNEDLADDLFSIHAPVKGATQVAAEADNFFGFSIHAPVKGATFNRF